MRCSRARGPCLAGALLLALGGCHDHPSPRASGPGRGGGPSRPAIVTLQVGEHSVRVEPGDGPAARRFTVTRAGQVRARSLSEGEFAQKFPALAARYRSALAEGDADGSWLDAGL
ncbi:MAG: hypothetical protein H6713_02875 [Myxococcales bacterium]|nr:hypothetical protein [Myxococcales bacterium]